MFERFTKKIVKTAAEPIKKEVKKTVKDKITEYSPLIKLGILVIIVGGTVFKGQPKTAATVVHNYYGSVTIISH